MGDHRRGGLISPPASSSSTTSPTTTNTSSQSAGTRTRSYTKKQWEEQKETIRWHYCVKGKKLQEVVEILGKADFIATEKQFKDRIKIWGFDKKIKMKEMKAIIRKRRLRKLQGKESKFEVRGRPVDEANIRRASARYGSCDGSTGSPVPSTPPEVHCYTPPRGGSPDSSFVKIVTPSEDERSNLTNESLSTPSKSSPLQPTLHIPQERYIPPSILVDSSRFFDSPLQENWLAAHNSSTSSFDTPYAPHIDPRLLQNDTFPELQSSSIEQGINNIIPTINIDFSQHTTVDPFSTPSKLPEFKVPLPKLPQPPKPIHIPEVPTIPLQGKEYKGTEVDELSELFDSFHVSSGLNHIDTIQALDNLAGVLKDQGRYGTAEALAAQAEQASEETLGVKHRVSIVTKLSRIDALACQGQYQIAYSALISLRTQATHYLGPNDHTTISISSLLSKILYAQGNYEQASQLAWQVFESERQRLGPLHINTLSAKAFRAVVLLQRDQAPKAERLLREVIAAYPVKDASLYDRYGDLAYALAIQGRYQSSSILERRILAAQTALLGHEHPNVLKTTVRLARTLRLQREFGEARELLIKVLPKQLRVLGDKSKEMGVTYKELGVCLNLMGKKEEGKKFLDKVRL